MDVNQTGTAGVAGVNGSAPGVAGTAGGPGGNISPTNSGNGVDTTNTTEATGGAGGGGGNGGGGAGTRRQRRCRRKRWECGGEHDDDLECHGDFEQRDGNRWRRRELGRSRQCGDGELWRRRQWRQWWHRDGSGRGNQYHRFNHRVGQLNRRVRRGG